MLVDLALTETGDLLFMEKPDDLKPQKILFNLTQTNTQKIAINFNDVKKVKHNSNSYLSIEFFIDKSLSKMMAVMLTEKQEKAQLITMKLKACLGELPERLEFGSKLSLFRHENINDSTIKSLERYLESILDKDILSVKVQAIPHIDYNNGYKQVIKINVFSSDNLIVEYKVER